MPIDLDSIPEPLAAAAKTGNLVPFIGAGVSQQAKTDSSKPFPNWTDLIGELERIAEVQNRISAADKLEIDGLRSKGKHLMAAQALKDAIPNDLLEEFLYRRFGDPLAEPGLIHERLFQLRPPLILTTNYDLLLEQAYVQVFKKTPVAWTFKQSNEVERFLKCHQPWTHLPIIFKIHGSASHPRETILSERDYRNLRYREHGYRAVLSAIFVTRVVLMLGFSFSDPEIMVLTETLRESLDNRSREDYIVLPRGEKGPVERRRLRDDFGLHVIEYEPTTGHPELLQLVEYLIGMVPPHGRLMASA
jgi:hypothetical protein